MSNSKFLLSCIALILSICTFSCSNDDECEIDCFLLEGTILDVNNGTPVAGATVYVYYSSSGLFERDEELGEVKTDADGFYSLSFRWREFADLRGTIQVGARRDEYIEAHEKDVPLNDGQDFPVNVDLTVVPIAEIEYHLKIRNEDISSFEIRTSFHTRGRRQFFHVLPLDTIVVDEVGADQMLPITIVYRKNEEQKIRHDSIYIEKGKRKPYYFTVE